MLSCNLYDAWGIHVDGDSVVVRITAPGGKVVLNERYYAVNGSLLLYEIGSLLEASMRSANLAYADFTFALLDEDGETADSCVVHTLYCDRFSVSTDTDVFLAENFLSTLGTRRVAPGSTTTLSYFAKAGEPTTATLSCLWRSTPEAETHAMTYEMPRPAMTADGIALLAVGQGDIVANIAQGQGVEASSIELLSFTATVGQRSVTCYVDRSLRDDCSFQFRNCFNVWEVAAFPHITTAKSEVKRSTAVVNNESTFYDQSASRTYEVQTGALTYDEAEWLDQLIASHEVRRPVPDDTDDSEPYVSCKVLITDSTCEVSDGDEKPNSVKFTWRYADNRPNVRLTASKGIFTSPYNIVFS